jgi:hypothetical protein
MAGFHSNRIDYRFLLPQIAFDIEISQRSPLLHHRFGLSAFKVGKAWALL